MKITKNSSLSRIVTSIFCSALLLVPSIAAVADPVSAINASSSVTQLLNQMQTNSNLKNLINAKSIMSSDYSHVESSSTISDLSKSCPEAIPANAAKNYVQLHYGLSDSYKQLWPLLTTLLISADKAVGKSCSEMASTNHSSAVFIQLGQNQVQIVSAVSDIELELLLDQNTDLAEENYSPPIDVLKADIEMAQKSVDQLSGQ